MAVPDVDAERPGHVVEVAAEEVGRGRRREGGERRDVEGESQDWLDSFFKAEKEVSRNSNNSFAKEQSENSQNILNKKLTKEELHSLLDRYKDIWQLEKQLVDFNIYEEKYEARIEVPAKK